MRRRNQGQSTLEHICHRPPDALGALLLRWVKYSELLELYSRQLQVVDTRPPWPAAASGRSTAVNVCSSGARFRSKYVYYLILCRFSLYIQNFS